MKNTNSLIGTLSLACVLCSPALTQSGDLGVFSNSNDVGDPAIKGSTEFSNGQYRISGSGANIWGRQDQFRYVWREVTGNFSITASVQLSGHGAEHRKAGIMVRQSLDGNSAYADVMIHGTGMPGLQWRSQKGSDTNTFDFPFDGPGAYRIKLVRSGVKIYMYLGKGDAELQKIANTEVSFKNPVLVGLAVCSHQADALTTATFSDVDLEQQPSPAAIASQ